MTHWNTEKVLKLFDGFCNAITREPGGDYDTTAVLVSAGNPATDYRLAICGFRTDDAISDAEIADVQMVEVTDGLDSRGGCNAEDEESLVFHARVVAKLKAAGFTVVPAMDDYF